MPLAGFGALTENYARENLSTYTAAPIQPSATTNVFGSWTEITVSTLSASDILIKEVSIYSNYAAKEVLFEAEFGIGVAGSEVTIFSFSGHIGLDTAILILRPNLFVPASPRFVCRVRNFTTDQPTYFANLEYLRL